MPTLRAGRAERAGTPHTSDRGEPVSEIRADVAVIGAGVVGLAIACELAHRRRDVVVVERERGAGRITSSRNSGVIHAGIYYPEGSLKAATCIEGRALLYERATRLGIPHRKTGKLIVACDDPERADLESIASRARALGVPLERLAGAEVARREPSLHAVEALRSPESGIVDAHALVESFRREAANLGVAFAFANEVHAIDADERGPSIEATDERGALTRCRAEHVVLSGGLDADRLAAAAGLDVDALGLRQTFVKGDYFVIDHEVELPRTPLVYPVPRGPGLGIHITVALDGARLAGPDATPVEAPSYDVEPGKAELFADAVARFLPAIRSTTSRPDTPASAPSSELPGAASATSRCSTGVLTARLGSSASPASNRRASRPRPRSRAASRRSSPDSPRRSPSISLPVPLRERHRALVLLPLRRLAPAQRDLLVVVLLVRTDLVAELEDRDLALPSVAHSQRNDRRADARAHVDRATRRPGSGTRAVETMYVLVPRDPADRQLVNARQRHLPRVRVARENERHPLAPETIRLLRDVREPDRRHVVPKALHRALARRVTRVRVVETDELQGLVPQRDDVVPRCRAPRRRPGEALVAPRPRPTSRS